VRTIFIVCDFDRVKFGGLRVAGVAESTDVVAFFFKFGVAGEVETVVKGKMGVNKKGR
jgi:hypothetical protein